MKLQHHASIIRPAQLTDADAIAKVQVDSWRTTYKGIMSDDSLAALSYDQHAKMWHKILSDAGPNKFAYVAEEEHGKLVGFALGGPERNGDPDYCGELYAIYLYEPYQRRGIGRSLMTLIAQNLLDAGLGSLLVWVLDANPCRSFYEALGGERLRDKRINVGGVQLVEVAYGWRDARILVNRNDSHHEKIRSK